MTCWAFLRPPPPPCSAGFAPAMLLGGTYDPFLGISIPMCFCAADHLSGRTQRPCNQSASEQVAIASALVLRHGLVRATALFHHRHCIPACKFTVHNQHRQQGYGHQRGVPGLAFVFIDHTSPVGCVGKDGRVGAKMHRPAASAATTLGLRFTNISASSARPAMHLSISCSKLSDPVTPHAHTLMLQICSHPLSNVEHAMAGD